MGRLKTNKEREEKKLNKYLANKKPKGRTKMNNAIAPGIFPGVKPEDLKSVGCKDCGPTRFIPICDLKIASQFQTTVGQPMIVNFQGGYACSKCGKVNHFDRTPDGKKDEEGKDNGDTPVESSKIIH